MDRDTEQALNDRLTTDGQRWRNAEPEPPPIPELGRGKSRRGRRRLGPLVLSCVLVACVMLAVYIVLPHAVNTPRQGDDNSSTSKSEPRTEDDMLDAWRRLVVRTGDEVRATGRFITSPRGRSFLCGQLSASLAGDPTQCDKDLQIDVDGLNPSRLAFRGTYADRVYGTATVIGTWTEGRIKIKRQLAPERAPAPRSFDVPCSAPKDGWSTAPLPSLDRLRSYLAARQTRFGPHWVGTVGNDHAGSPSTPAGTQVVIVPIIGAEPESLRPELAAVFGGNLCLIRGARSLADLTAARDATRSLMTDHKNMIVAVGGGDGDRVTVRPVVITEQLLLKFQEIGLDLLFADPVITPK